MCIIIPRYLPLSPLGGDFDSEFDRVRRRRFNFTDIAGLRSGSGSCRPDGQAKSDAKKLFREDMPAGNAKTFRADSVTRHSRDPGL